MVTSIKKNQSKGAQRVHTSMKNERKSFAQKNLSTYLEGSIRSYVCFASLHNPKWEEKMTYLVKGGDAEKGRWGKVEGTRTGYKCNVHIITLFDKQQKNNRHQFHIFSIFHLCSYTRLTALFPGLHTWAGTRKVKPIWILLKHKTVSGSGISWDICKSARRSRQITTPAP